jgi:hypothetical protein
MADSHVLFMPIHLSPEGLSVLGICTVKYYLLFAIVVAIIEVAHLFIGD